MNKAKSKTYWTKEDDKLFQAVEKNNENKVDVLMAKKTFYPAKLHPQKGVSSLHVAVRDGFTQIVEKFLEQQPFAGINAKDSQGQTSLQYAAKKARYSILLKLLECNPDLCCVDNNKRSVLHHASDGGHINCVQLLITAGAPISFKDKDGKTALAYAAEKGQASICRLLIEKGSKVNEVDHDNLTPLMLASINKHASVCAYLVGKGADVNILDVKGHDALWHATWNMDKETARVLTQVSHNDINNNQTNKTDSEMSKIRDFNEREIIEDDHYEDMASIKADSRNRAPFASTPCILKEQSSCNLFPMNKDDFNPSFPEKSISLVNLGERNVSSVEQENVGNIKDKRLNTSTSRQTHTLSATKSEIEEDQSVSDVKLNMASFRALLDNTFHKNPKENKKKEGVERRENIFERSSEYVNINEITGCSVKEGVATQKTIESISPPLSFSQRDTHSNRSICSSKTSETLSGSHVVQGQFSPKQDDHSFVTNSPHSFNHLQTYELDYVPENDTYFSTNSSKCNTLNNQTSASAVRGVDQVDGNNLDHSAAEKNYILKEKMELLEKLKSALEQRKGLEEEKKELLKALEMASVSHQWTLHELRSMNTIVNQMLSKLHEDKTKEKNGGGDGGIVSSLDKEELSKDLKSVQCRIDDLLALHEKDCIDEDQDVLINDEVDDGSEHKEYLNKKIISLVKEKNLLAYKLKQILGENLEMNNYLKEMEEVTKNAIDLKKENETLIKEYEKFKKIQEDEMLEVDDLFEFFRETLTKNESLKIENENLAIKVNSPSVDNEEMMEMKKENLKLLFEKVQLEEKVKEQTQTLEEIEEINLKKKISELQTEGISAQRVRDMNTFQGTSQDEREEKHLEEMYENLKVDYLRKEEEAETNRELLINFQKTMCDNEGVKKETESLKKRLEEENANVKTLNETIQRLNEKMMDSFEKYKKALEGEEMNRQKLESMEIKNNKLEKSVEELKADLDKKKLNEKSMASNLILEQEQDLVDLKKKMMQLARKKCAESDMSENESFENIKVFEILQNAVEESLELKHTNLNIKNHLKELELKNNIEIEDNKKLKFANDNLQVEIASLKRTIKEQSSYLSVMSPRSNGPIYDEIDASIIKPMKETEIKQTFQFNVKSDSSLLEKEDSHDELNKKTNQQQVEIRRLKDEIVILNSQIECLQQNENEFFATSQIHMQRKADEIEDLETKVSKLNEKYSQIEKINFNMKEELKENEKKFSESKSIDQELNYLISLFKSQSGIDCDQFSEKKDSLISMSNWLDEEKKVKYDLGRANERFEKEVVVMKNKIIEMEKKQEETEKKKIDTNKEDNFKLQNCLLKLENETKKVKKLEEKIVKYDEETESVKFELNKVTNLLNESHEKLKVIEKKESSKVNAIQKDILQMDNFEGEKKELVQQLVNLNKEYNKLKTSITIKNEKIKYLKEDMRLQISDIKRKNDEALKEVEDKLEEMKKENGKLKNELMSVYEKSPSNVGKKIVAEPFSKTEVNMTDEKYFDAIEIRKESKEEVLKLEAKLEEMLEEKNKSLEEIQNLESLCSELRNMNKDLNQKYSKLLERNDNLSDKDSYNENMLKEYEDRRQIINELRETTRNTTEKLGRFEEENQKLVLQKKQAEMMLKIEKLKNKSESNKTYRSNDIFLDKQIIVPLSSMSASCGSNEAEDFVDQCKRWEDDLYNGVETKASENVVCSNENKNKMNSYDNDWSFNSSHRYLTFMKTYLSSPLCSLKLENRKKFLDIIGIQSCLRRKFFLENTSEDVCLSNVNGHSSLNNTYTNGYDDDNHSIHNANNSLLEDFLNLLSTKCFECFSIIVGLEERVDFFLGKIHKDISTEDAHFSLDDILAELITRFKTHKQVLKRLKSLLESVLNGHLDIKRASEYLCQPLDGFVETCITMKSNYVFNVTKNQTSPQNRIRVIRNSCSDSDERNSSGDDTSPKKLRSLEKQLKENERRYREVISSYRRHLIAAVQGDMDPSIKAALLNIVETSENNGLHNSL